MMVKGIERKRYHGVATIEDIEAKGGGGNYSNLIPSIPFRPFFYALD